MRVLEGVMYINKPDDIWVDPYSVDVCVSAKEVDVESIDGTTHKEWECTIHRYESGEYIAELVARNAELEQQITQAQVCLVEMYEVMLEQE